MAEADQSRQIRLLGNWWNIKRVVAAEKSLKPDILIAEHNGEIIVAKDFRNKVWVARWFWGPLNIMYEKFILQKLRDIKGIPSFIGLEDYNCLLISYISGDEIKKSQRSLSPTYFTDLFKIAEDIHDRGILHLDLGHKSNIMVDRKGNPAIIDFNTSIYLPQNTLFSPLFHLLKKIDTISILRLKIRFDPEKTTLEEKQRVKKFLIIRKLWIFDKLSRRITNFTKKEQKPLP